MEALNELLRLVILAFTVEAVWETLKMTYDKDKLNKSTLGALIVGVLVSLTVNFDILIVLGFSPVIPFVGVVLAGIVISRGGNFVHNYIKTVTDKEVKDAR